MDTPEEARVEERSSHFTRELGRAVTFCTGRQTRTTAARTTCTSPRRAGSWYPSSALIWASGAGKSPRASPTRSAPPS